MPESWPFLLVGGITLFLFFILGFASRKLKLPSVLGFILLGIALAGWLGKSGEALHYIAEIGIVLLFFILGLEFPLQRMRDISIRIWPAGLLDVVLNLGVGLLIALLFGLNLVTAILIGAVVYASSSSITLKMLEEKKRLASPEAEFILALLIFEDLVAPVLVSFLAGVYTGAEISFPSLGFLLVKILAITGGAILIALYGFRKLSVFVERYLEADFMPLFTIGIAFAYAGLAMWLGLSEVLGAFLAGVMLSETGRSKELEHLVMPVRNITLPFFFFWFGTTISLAEGIPMAGLLAVLAVWSLIAKVLVGFYGGKIYGLSPRASVRAGLSLGQRGEFSAIIATLAPPQLRAFCGIYILITAFAGIYMFNKAPKWARWVNDRFFCKPGPEIKAEKAS
ncbi:cation:proton antiporter [Candidatus Desulforudis audaxviator]|uniref:Sodium/hydrogen exchanger n=1 Tax=Desulforudis audaxviator (strain MP104C) TaxID=477974 RepID=B1I305_DESAP|nr:cation:proton antiporter [Candidatus Desulforudis audaxviator]ACA59374.1 sodium/hydrogen exchanger [Candidatus Desulforudis audaxviator MP104C]AZK59353.1 sodium/hydrogen exchanger family protein [Candidatus Desulforudis audaxviator]